MLSEEKPGSKVYIFYDSICMKFWTKQSYRDRKQVSLCLWGWGKELTTTVYEGNLQSEGGQCRVFIVVTAT